MVITFTPFLLLMFHMMKRMKGRNIVSFDNDFRDDRWFCGRDVVATEILKGIEGESCS